MEVYERARLVSELRKIEQQRAEQRQIEAAKHGIEGGRPKNELQNIIEESTNEKPLANKFANTTTTKKKSVRKPVDKGTKNKQRKGRKKVP